MKTLENEKRYLTGKILCWILISFCTLFLMFITISIIFNIDIGMDNDGYITCYIFFTIMMLIFIYFLLICKNKRVFFDYSTQQIVYVSAFNRKTKIQVDFNELVAIVSLRTGNKYSLKNMCKVMIFRGHGLVETVNIKKDNYIETIHSVGINNIKVIE